MNRTKSILLAASLAIMAIGCNQVNLLDSDLADAEAYLDLDSEPIEVEAASFHADSAVIGTVKVTSSRSWSLEVAETVTGTDGNETQVPQWLQVSSSSGLNLGKAAKSWPLSIELEDNPEDTDRPASLMFFYDGKKKTVELIQKAFTPVVTVENVSYNIPDIGEDLSIYVRSNCAWTARLKEGSTADLTISNGSGFKSDSLKISVNSNMDVASGKEAVILISADGLAEDVELSIAQDICIPYISIDEEKIETEVLPIGGTHEVPFQTNVYWTARLVDASEGIVLNTDETTRHSPDELLYITFPEAKIDGASATVVITTEGGLEDYVTFTQEGCIFIPFRKWSYKVDTETYEGDNNGFGSIGNTSILNLETGKYEIPRTTDNSNAFLELRDNYVGKDKHGYRYLFDLSAEDNIFRSESCGLVIGSITQNPAFYIEFPAIEGKTLREIKIMLGNSDVKLTNQESTAIGTVGRITDTDGNVVSGGETQQVKTYQKQEDWVYIEHDKSDGTKAKYHVQKSFDMEFEYHTESMFHFILTQTQPGTAYRFVGDYRMVIRWFILYYE